MMCTISHFVLAAFFVLHRSALLTLPCGTMQLARVLLEQQVRFWVTIFMPPLLKYQTDMHSLCSRQNFQ